MLFIILEYYQHVSSGCLLACDVSVLSYKLRLEAMKLTSATRFLDSSGVGCTVVAVAVGSKNVLRKLAMTRSGA